MSRVRVWDVAQASGAVHVTELSVWQLMLCDAAQGAAVMPETGGQSGTDNSDLAGDLQARS